MKLTFNTQNIDSVEVEGDHIYVYFTDYPKMAVCFNTQFFDKYLDSIGVRNYDWVYCEKENLEQNVKDFLNTDIERQEKYS